MKNDKLKVKKSEILFLYESQYNMPNGDPFTGEQRYDDETKKILVSDVRIKRYIRNYLDQLGERIFVQEKEPPVTASDRFEELNKEIKNSEDKYAVVKSAIDVRLFGAVVSIQPKKVKAKDEKKNSDSNEDKKETAFNITGPVQFALLNPSLNQVDLRIHQNTSVFSSKKENKQGAIGTTSVVPYAINQIHGWINPYSALETDLTEEDIAKMSSALWHSVNNINTRTKSNQNSLLLLRIVYKDPNRKIYGLDRLIKIQTDKPDEHIRSIEDYDLVLTDLIAKGKEEYIDEIQYYTEDEKILEKLRDADKFKMMKLE